MLFQVFHGWNRLVRQGVKPALVCSECEHEVALMMGENDEPILTCFFCGLVTNPEDIYDSLKAQVAEFFDLPPE